MWLWVPYFLYRVQNFQIKTRDKWKKHIQHKLAGSKEQDTSHRAASSTTKSRCRPLSLQWTPFCESLPLVQSINVQSKADPTAEFNWDWFCTELRLLMLAHYFAGFDHNPGRMFASVTNFDSNSDSAFWYSRIFKNWLLEKRATGWDESKFVTY